MVINADSQKKGYIKGISINPEYARFWIQYN